MTSTLFLIGTIKRNQFRYDYLRNKNLFANFVPRLWNVNQILNILNKKMTLIAYVFPKLGPVKHMVTDSLITVNETELEESLS